MTTPPPPGEPSELSDLSTAAEDAPVRELHLHRRYFDLVAAGRKTVEVRVKKPKARTLQAGERIRFVCDQDDVVARVKRVTGYTSFEEMLDGEDPASVDPDSSREQQLVNIRRIYSPEEEALGVLAIELDPQGDAAAWHRPFDEQTDPLGRY